MATAYEYIEKNKRRSFLFAALFPISFTLFIYLVVWFFHFLWSLLIYIQRTNVIAYSSLWHKSLESMYSTCAWLLPMCFGMAVFWAWQASKQGDRLLLESLPHVHPLPYWEAEEAHQLLENLCIASGDYLPALYILKDDSMNAFSLGMTPMRGYIILSSGLLKRLNRSQLEGVLAHELAHIRHYDTRLMVIIITCLAFFTYSGEFLVHGIDTSDMEYEAKNLIKHYRKSFLPLRMIFMYVGVAMMFYGYFLAPLIRCALSHSRESMADAQAVLMTRYPRGLARALWLISQDSRIEMLDEHPLLGTMCIAPPGDTQGIFAFLSGINRIHIPLERRLRALNDMDGLFIQPK